MGYALADPIIGLIITAVILGIVWQSAKAVLTRMLDGVGVDPTISLTDARKVADDVKEHARGHLPALESLHVEVVPASGRERAKHHPEPEHEHHH